MSGPIASKADQLTFPPLLLSLVVPVFQEEESLPHLIRQVREALLPAGISYELICVDDGSRDQSYQTLLKLSRDDPSLVLISFRRNFGQTAAMQAGLDVARGEVVAFMDADLQNDPADLPVMIARLKDADDPVDMVVGWRFDRQDALLNRRLPSMIANRLISRVTGVKLHDYGCSLKVIDGELAKTIKLYGELHRFIPAVAHWAGARIVEVKVNHRARQFGVSKYGIGRTVRVVLDLITVAFMQSYLVRPMQVFGLAGLLSGGAGFFICSYLATLKLLYGEPLSERPLLMLGVLLIMVGVQLVSMGLMTDLLARTYHEAQGKPPYHIRHKLSGEGARPAQDQSAQSAGRDSAP